jgi:HAD superfamily hydrolase (TIGR01450 family)
MEAIPKITATELMDRYEVLLLDAYGVLVTGDGALPGAAEFIDALNRRGQRYYMLTNSASRLPETAAKRYRGFGLDIAPDRIITSGALLVPYFSAHGLVGARCIVLGPADSLRYVELAGGRVVGLEDDFDALVVCDEMGFPFLESVDAAISRLIEQFDRGSAVPLILPNPDLIYPTGRGFGITSGSIALMIEAALRLRYPDRNIAGFVPLGKPHPAIFEEAVRRAGLCNMVMIGDQLETDVRGADAFGIDSALVAGGVAGAAIPEGAPRPTWLLTSLALGEAA